MLPALANYFGITVDELLGMEQVASAAEYDSINVRWMDNRAAGKHIENVLLMREALKRYPNDALLLVQLSSSLERLEGTEDEKKAWLRESILLQEQILRGPDSQVRSATLYNICFAYEKIGEHEKAIAIAKKLPNLFKARENAFVSLLNGEEKRNAALCALAPLAHVIAHHLTALAETEKKEHYKEKIQMIYEILFDEYSLEEVTALWSRSEQAQNSCIPT